MTTIYPKIVSRKTGGAALNFYINRACRLRTKEQLVRLEAAKDDLRVLNGRPRKGPMPKAEPGD